MELIYIKREELRLADYNPRIMPENELIALRNSIATFGFAEPIIVNKHRCEKCGDRVNVVVGGHQRIKATEGMSDHAELPAIPTDLHIDGEMELNIALNKVGGKFDTIKLKHLMRALEKDPYTGESLEVTGFTKDQIANILEPVEMPELDAFAKVPDGDMPDYTTMSFTVSKRQAAEIIKAANATKAEYKTAEGETDEETLGYALVEMAQQYIKIYGQKENSTA